MGADFGSTHWSVVLEAAKADGSPEARAALEALCRAYWQPLRVYARRRGLDDHAAEDVTQEFFARQVATGALFKGVAPQRGKFRCWLQSAMWNHLNTTWDFERAAKRGGGHGTVPLEAFVAAEGALAPPPDAPEVLSQYDRAWATQLLHRARELLSRRYRENEKTDAFEQLRRFLPGEEGSLAEAAERLGKTRGATKTLVSRFRADFGDAVRAEIRRTVSSDKDVDDEIRALIKAVAT